MRKGLWFIPLLLLFLASPAYARFDTSHHDLKTYDTGLAASCSYCHGIRVTTGVTLSGTDNAGVIGRDVCLGRCHALTGIYTSEPGNLQPRPPAYLDLDGSTWQADTYMGYRAVLFNVSHPITKGTTASNASTIFPYDASVGSNNGLLECTSCHSVHDDANSPFIWRRLFAAPPSSWSAPTVTNATGLCVTCHLNYYATGGTSGGALAAPSGYHPAEFIVSTANATGRAAGVASVYGTVRHGRLISIDAIGGRSFDMATPSGATLRAAKGTSGTSWITGGKMITSSDNTFSNFADDGTRVMGCSTCHSAHKTAVAGSNHLTVMIMDNVSEGWNPICLGCHGAATTWANNKYDNVMGSASTYGHPVGSNAQDNNTAGGYQASTGAFHFSVNTATTPAWQKGSTDGQIMCTSCHDVHGGAAGSMAIRDLGQTNTRVVCKQCHNGVGLPNVADISHGGGSGEGGNAHHRTRASGALPAPGATVTNYVPAEETGANPLTIKAPSWAGAVGSGTGPFLGLGDLSTGMDCADCHVFNGTAHNW